MTLSELIKALKEIEDRGNGEAKVFADWEGSRVPILEGRIFVEPFKIVFWVDQ